MEMVFLAQGSAIPEHWFDPLRDALKQVRGEPEYAFARFDDFTPRALVLRPRRADVVQYHHRPSDRYLYVDFHGLVFKFVRPKDLTRSAGRLMASSIYEELEKLRPARFDPPAATRLDGRPALRLLHGETSA